MMVVVVVVLMSWRRAYVYIGLLVEGDVVNEGEVERSLGMYDKWCMLSCGW